PGGRGDDGGRRRGGKRGGGQRLALAIHHRTGNHLHGRVGDAGRGDGAENPDGRQHEGLESNQRDSSRSSSTITWPPLPPPSSLERCMSFSNRNSATVPPSWSSCSKLKPALGTAEFTASVLPVQVTVTVPPTRLNVRVLEAGAGGVAGAGGTGCTGSSTASSRSSSTWISSPAHITSSRDSCAPLSNLTSTPAFSAFSSCSTVKPALGVALLTVTAPLSQVTVTVPPMSWKVCVVGCPPAPAVGEATGEA